MTSSLQDVPLFGRFFNWCRSEDDCRCRYYREANGWGTRKFGLGEPLYDAICGLDASDASCIACQSHLKKYLCVRKLLPCHMQVLRTRRQRMRAVRYLLRKRCPEESCCDSSESDSYDEPPPKPRKKFVRDMGDKQICDVQPPRRRDVCEPKKSSKNVRVKEVCLCEKPKKSCCARSEDDCRACPSETRRKPRTRRVCGFFCGKVRSDKCASPPQEEFCGDPHEKPCRMLHAPPCDQPRIGRQPRDDICPQPPMMDKGCYDEDPCTRPKKESFCKRFCRCRRFCRCKSSRRKKECACRMPSPEPQRVCRKPTRLKGVCEPRSRADICDEPRRRPKARSQRVCKVDSSRSQTYTYDKKKQQEYTCVRDPEYKCRRPFNVRNAPCCASTTGDFKREWKTSTTPPCSKEWDTKVCCKQPPAPCCRPPEVPAPKGGRVTCCRQAAGGVMKSTSSSSETSSEMEFSFAERCRKAFCKLMPSKNAP